MVCRSAPSRGEGLAEDQRIADLRHVLLSFQQIEIPVAILRVAIEHRAHNEVLLDDHALVNAARSVAPDNVLSTFPTCTVGSDDRRVGKACVSTCGYRGTL